MTVSPDLIVYGVLPLAAATILGAWFIAKVRKKRKKGSKRESKELMRASPLSPLLPLSPLSLLPPPSTLSPLLCVYCAIEAVTLLCKRL